MNHFCCSQAQPKRCSIFHCSSLRVSIQCHHSPNSFFNWARAASISSIFSSILLSLSVLICFSLLVPDCALPFWGLSLLFSSSTSASVIFSSFSKNSTNSSPISCQQSNWKLWFFLYRVESKLNLSFLDLLIVFFFLIGWIY